MATAYNMHAQWRVENPRRVLERARRHGGTITPYARIPGTLRSYIVSWQDRGEEGNDYPLEGHLYVVRCKPLKRDWNYNRYSNPDGI